MSPPGATDLSKRFVTACAASLLAAFAFLATPAAAQDTDYPPPPPPDDQQDPGQPPPEVDYGQPVAICCSDTSG